MKKILLILISMLFINGNVNAQEENDMSKKVIKSEKEWKEILSDEQYHILREKGTDLPSFDGYSKHFKKGTYHCTACNAQLFTSDSKYDSNCGWPSFDDAIEGTVEFTPDHSLGMIRTEITCTRCGGHLGHIFDDGPKETTGKRYCVNTTSITFVKSKRR